MKTALICLFIKFCRCLLLIKADHVHTTLVDPDLQIKRGEGGGEGGHPDPEKRRGTRSQIFFSALRASVWSTNKSRGGEG